jgi:glycosyltransferase involved in cell wall biosynthesis
MSAPQFSIIICTRNRARLLRQAMDGLLSEPFDPNLYEVLVVDGSSTDGTPEMVREISGRLPHVFYLNCPERGLPKARVYGAARARGAVIGYLDDDAKPCAGWLKRAAEIVDRLNPVCFGGPFFAFYETPKPRWFKDEYGSFTHGSEARYLSVGEFLCGGNIFFRRDALAAAGGFDPDFCAGTDAFAYGEEGVPQLRLRDKLPTDPFYYDPELFILHLVRPERMNVWRGVREAFEMGRGYGKLSLGGRVETRRLPFARRLVAQGVQFGLKLVLLTPFRDRRAFPHWENFVYENAAREIRAAGTFYEFYLRAARARNGRPQ